MQNIFQENTLVMKNYTYPQMDDVKICSLNVKGLRDGKKRTAVFTWLKKKNFTVYFLQETHSTQSDCRKWNSDWGSTCVWSHGTSQSRGSAILFNKNCDVKLLKCVCDTEGRYVIIDFKISDVIYTIANIYGPNKDSPDFYKKVDGELDNFHCVNIIYGGDLNCVLNLSLDKKGGRSHTNFKSQKEIFNLMAKRDLVDIWRYNNPGKFQYTWKSNDKPPIMCRLDYLLISNGLKGNVTNVDIKHGLKSDHSLVTLMMCSKQEKRGKGMWKFNVSLLDDLDFTNLINKTIENVKIDNANARPDILWETIKCVIRGDTINYASRKRKRTKKIEECLEQDINNLEIKYAENPSEPILRDIEIKKHKLDSIYDEKVKGAIIRSKADCTEFGEKSSKYFFNLERYRVNNKSITKLVDDEGNEVTGTENILNEEVKFYSTLYTSQCNTDLNAQEGLTQLGLSLEDIPKVTENNKDECEGILNMQECTDVVKEMKQGKSPGSDGYPIEFYTFFWDVIGQVVVDCFNYCFEKGCMTDEQCRGVITLIPKEGKDNKFLKNWRPISLLNVDYKIVSKAIANRFKKVLNSVISPDQTGFLSNRYIGENVRLILDIIEYVDNESLPGMLLFLDFEKAYDKLEWKFVQNCLGMFGFGGDAKKWVTLFYTNIKSCVTNMGVVSNYFDLSRGLRQGCPLSCYIFIICAEVLAIAIRKNKCIKGINIKGNESVLTQFADDTTLILDGSKDSLVQSLKVLKSFSKISGLCVNYSKSSVLKIGSLKNDETILHPDANLIWSKGPVKFLGVNISLNKQLLFELNYEVQFQKLSKILNIWLQRGLTPIGRVLVIKSLAISQLTYLLSVLPNPPDSFLKKIEKLFFKFIWNGKQDKINRDTMYNKVDEGGLNMTNIYDYKDAIKISWVKRFVDPNNEGKWKILFDNEIKKIGGDWIWQCEPANVCDLNVNKISNSFLKDILKGWLKLRKKYEIVDKIIWYNSKIKIGKKTVFYRSWSNSNIIFLSDLIESDHLMSFMEFKKKYHAVKTNFVEYSGIVQSIKKNLKESCSKLFTLTGNNERNDQLLTDIVSTKRVCKFAYEKIRYHVIPNAKQFWEGKAQVDIDLSQPITDWKEVYTLAFKCCMDSYTRYFQFRYIHNILPTNYFLFKIGLIDTDICSFCKVNRETVKHLMWECNVTKDFWNNLSTWMNTVLNIFFNVNYQNICLGLFNEDFDFFKNIIILLAKRYIYRCRVEEKKLSIYVFKELVKMTEKSEKVIAERNNRIASHNKRWGILFS